MPASVRCQPMCGRLNLRDFETAVGGGWAAFTRRGSGDSHDPGSGIRDPVHGVPHVWNECSYVSRCNFRADHYLWRAASFRLFVHDGEWAPLHMQPAAPGRPRAAPAPPRAGRGGRPLSRDASPRPPKRMARQTPPAPPSPCLPAAAVTHGSGHDPTHWALHLPSFQAEVLRSRTPRLSDAALPPTHPPPPQDHRHMLTTCWQHRPALKCEGARRL